jgi:hypothetical protein
MVTIVNLGANMGLIQPVLRSSIDEYANPVKHREDTDRWWGVSLQAEHEYQGLEPSIRLLHYREAACVVF